MSIKDLNNKAWYRLIKIIYWFSFLLVLIFLTCYITEKQESNILLKIFWLSLIPLLSYLPFEIFKRVFYYIALGEIIPNKKFIKNKKIVITILCYFLVIAFFGIASLIFAPKSENIIIKHSHLTEPKVELIYNPNICDKDSPLLITINNETDRTITKTYGRMSVYRKGYSKDLTYGPGTSFKFGAPHSNYFSNDKIINPGEKFQFCTGYELSEDNKKYWDSVLNFKINNINYEYLDIFLEETFLK